MSRVAAAQSPAEEPRGSISVLGALDVPFAGAFTPATETSGLFGTLRLVGHDFDAVYGRPRRVGIEVAYGRVFFRAWRSHARNREPLLVQDFIVRTLPGSLQTYAGFSDYRAWTIEGGHRIVRNARGAIRPYVGGAIGIAIVQAIRTDPCCILVIDPATPYYRRSFAPTATGLVGATVAAMEHLAIGLETGVRFQGDLEGDLTNPRFGLFDEEDLGGRVWSMPLTAFVRAEF